MSPKIFTGALNSNSIGWEINISLDFNQRVRIYY